MSTAHLILGETVDYITGETIVDTHDERARQSIARFLVEEKGYAKDDIDVRRKIELTVDGEKGYSRVDFVIKVSGRPFAVVIFGPGSLVTRERSTLAAARLIEDQVVPLAVISNGKDAEVLDTRSGAVIAEELEGIPTKEQAVEKISRLICEKLPEDRLEKERRILFAFDVLAERECDEFTCSLY